MNRMVPIEVLGTVPPFSPGDTTEIELDHLGIPTDHNWRRKHKQRSIRILSEESKPEARAPKRVRPDAADAGGES